MFVIWKLLAIVLLALLMTGLPVAASQDDLTDLPHARQLLDHGKIDEGMVVLKELSARQPGLKGLAHAWGVAYYKKSNYSQAVPYLQEALKESPNDKEAVQLLGLSYYFSGKTADAIPLLERSQSWYHAEMSTHFTSSVFAMWVPKIMMLRAQRLRRCLALRRIPLPVTCSPRRCSSATTSRPWPKSVRK